MAHYSEEEEESEDSQSLPPYPIGFEPMKNASPEFSRTASNRNGINKPKQPIKNTRFARKIPIHLANSSHRPPKSVSITSSDPYMHTQMSEVSKLVLTSDKIVIIAGAGISVAAGIQDFRSSTGAYAEYSKDLFHNSVYLGGNNDRLKSYLAMVTKLWARCQQAVPTNFHHLASELAYQGNLIRMYTQNFDGLEMKDELLGTKTVQLHGDINTAICSRCKTECKFQPEMFQDLDNLATCSACPILAKEAASKSGYNLRQNLAGVLKPKLVLYGDSLFHQTVVDDTIQEDILTKPDVVIIAGTSMNIYVQGVRDLLSNFRKQGCIIIWVNISSPPQDIAVDIDFQVLGTADCFADNISNWAASNIWEITKWNLEIAYPPSISFTTNRGWGRNRTQADYERSEEDMLRQDETIVLDFWETYGGRDQAIRQEYQKKGETVHSTIPRVIFEVLEKGIDNSDHKKKENAYKIKWQGYPGFDWVPERYVQIYGGKKLKEYMQAQEHLG